MADATTAPSELVKLGVVERQHTSREALAWAAGLFDGEGSSITKTGRSGVRTYAIPGLCMTQKDREVLDRLQGVLGVGQIYERRTAPGSPWAWQTTNWRDAQVAIAMLWPWLGSIKRAQAQRVFSAWKVDATRDRWRIVRCANGHDWTDPANVYQWPGNTRFGPRRICRPCQRDRLRRRRGTP